MIEIQDVRFELYRPGSTPNKSQYCAKINDCVEQKCKVTTNQFTIILPKWIIANKMFLFFLYNSKQMIQMKHVAIC